MREKGSEVLDCVFCVTLNKISHLLCDIFPYSGIRELIFYLLHSRVVDICLSLFKCFDTGTLRKCLISRKKATNNDIKYCFVLYYSLIFN